MSSGWESRQQRTRSEILHPAGETIAALKTIVAGVKIETHGWEHRLGAILDYAGL